MKWAVCFLGVFLCFWTVAQKNTQAKGTLFTSIGVNSTNYFPTKLHFSSSPTISVKGLDSQLFEQFNAKVGYYFRNHVALSFRIDQQYYNYVNSVNFKNNFVCTSIEISRTEKLLNSKNKKFALSGIIGASSGAVMNRTLRTDVISSQQTSWKCSGLALSGMVALRTEFYKRFYLQLEERVQYFYQKNQANSKIEYENSTYFLGMYQTSLTLGFFMYRKFYDDCNTCPKW